MSTKRSVACMCVSCLGVVGLAIALAAAPKVKPKQATGHDQYWDKRFDKLAISLNALKEYIGLRQDDYPKSWYRAEDFLMFTEGSLSDFWYKEQQRAIRALLDAQFVKDTGVPATPATSPASTSQPVEPVKEVFSDWSLTPKLRFFLERLFAKFANNPKALGEYGFTMVVNHLPSRISSGDYLVLNLLLLASSERGSKKLVVFRKLRELPEPPDGSWPKSVLALLNVGIKNLQNDDEGFIIACQGYTGKIPKEVITDKTLSALWKYYVSKRNWSDRRMQLMVLACIFYEKESYSEARTALSELKKEGYVSKEQQHSAEGLEKSIEIEFMLRDRQRRHEERERRKSK